jgi:catechol 2,3-dioxygenase-like lactoylglutathione lyase family enzyme
VAVKGIAFTGYAVADLDRAIAFYRDVLGVPFDRRYGDVYAEFIAPDGAALGLIKLRDDVKAMPDFAMNVGEPGTGRGLALEVDDIGATLADLAAKGFATPSTIETPVCRMTTIDDPDGNRIIVHQRLPAKT